MNNWRDYCHINFYEEQLHLAEHGKMGVKVRQSCETQAILV